MTEAKKPEARSPEPAATTQKAADSAPGGIPTSASVMEALRPVFDPELHLSIVDLGLIYGVDVSPDGKRLGVRMTLTGPGCPIGPELMAAVDHTARTIPGVEEVEVALVWDPPWDPVKMASETAKEALGIW